MAGEYAIPTVNTNAEKRYFGLSAVAWAVAAVVLIGAVLVTLHIVAQLDAMSADLARVSTSLDSLKVMNQKLDMLNGMSVTLRQMNGKLSITNHSLDAANRQLSGMAAESHTADGSLQGMQRTLSGMQSDIRVMSHKLSGSFLFRSVK